MRRITLLPLLALFLGCGETQTPPTEPVVLGTGDVAAQLGPDGMAYEAVGDCSQSTLLDPGRIRQVDGLTIIQGQVFDCPLSGDMTGVVRVRWRNAVFGPGPEGGHVTGTTTLILESLFGDTDVSGGFEGPFSASLADLLFGESIINRSGFGDFQGMVMHGTFHQDPPGSGRTVEDGAIQGR